MTVMDEDCVYCAAGPDEACALGCPATVPTDDERAHDVADVGPH